MINIKKIIACLDLKDGLVVKGVRYENIKDVGDPIETAAFYSAAGADELVFLDITASYENRPIFIDTIEKLAGVIDIPFTVGGGVNSLDIIESLIAIGADKVLIGTAGMKNPDLIAKAAQRFGSERIAAAVDARLAGDRLTVVIDGGRTDTGVEVTEWTRRVEQLGAGEILLTSMDRDGTKSGYDIALLKSVVVNIPVIASGGAGSMEHFYEVFTETNATGALAASLFHYREIEIQALKKYLRAKGIPLIRA